MKFSPKRKYGKLTVIKRAEKNKHGQAQWLCRCDCGKEKIVSQGHLRGGFVKSCGHLFRKHGETKTALFNVWSGMLKRCRLKTRHDFKNYGGRGIAVCSEWKEFEKFKKDMGQQYIEAKNKYGKAILDRVDNEKGYSKENCRFVNAKESAKNRRSTRWIEYKGEKKTLTEWAKEKNMSVTGLSDRIKSWGVEKALET